MRVTSIPGLSDRDRILLLDTRLERLTALVHTMAANMSPSFTWENFEAQWVADNGVSWHDSMAALDKEPPARQPKLLHPWISDAVGQSRHCPHCDQDLGPADEWVFDPSRRTCF